MGMGHSTGTRAATAAAESTTQWPHTGSQHELPTAITTDRRAAADASHLLTTRSCAATASRFRQSSTCRGLQYAAASLSDSLRSCKHCPATAAAFSSTTGTRWLERIQRTAFLLSSGTLGNFRLMYHFVIFVLYLYDWRAFRLASLILLGVSYSHGHMDFGGPTLLSFFDLVQFDNLSTMSDNDLTSNKIFWHFCRVLGCPAGRCTVSCIYPEDRSSST